jgi:hypothetical protein
MSVRWRRWSLIVLIVVLLGLLVTSRGMRGPLARAVGWVLVVDDPVGRADVIVVPVWAGAEAAIDAADLVHNGIASRVAVLPELKTPAEEELTRRGVPYQDETADLVELLHALGVETVEVTPNPITGTTSEGDVLPGWCEEQQIHAIVVLSTPDHSRRVRRVLRRAFRGRSTTVAIRSARFSSFDPDRWWDTRDSLRTGIVEVQKLLLDVALHPLS